jgi:hypothetical protein
LYNFEAAFKTEKNARKRRKVFSTPITGEKSERVQQSKQGEGSIIFILENSNIKTAIIEENLKPRTNKHGG